MKTIKVRIDSVNVKYIRVTIFSGDIGFTLHNNGSLCFDHDEYMAFVNGLSSTDMVIIQYDDDDVFDKFKEDMEK